MHYKYQRLLDTAHQHIVTAPGGFSQQPNYILVEMASALVSSSKNHSGMTNCLLLAQLVCKFINLPWMVLVPAQLHESSHPVHLDRLDARVSKQNSFTNSLSRFKTGSHAIIAKHAAFLLQQGYNKGGISSAAISPI